MNLHSVISAHVKLTRIVIFPQFTLTNITYNHLLTLLIPNVLIITGLLDVSPRNICFVVCAFVTHAIYSVVILHTHDILTVSCFFNCLA